MRQMPCWIVQPLASHPMFALPRRHICGLRRICLCCVVYSVSTRYIQQRNRLHVVGCMHRLPRWYIFEHGNGHKHWVMRQLPSWLVQCGGQLQVLTVRGWQFQQQQWCIGVFAVSGWNILDVAWSEFCCGLSCCSTWQLCGCWLNCIPAMYCWNIPEHHRRNVGFIVYELLARLLFRWWRHGLQAMPSRILPKHDRKCALCAVPSGKLYERLRLDRMLRM